VLTAYALSAAAVCCIGGIAASAGNGPVTSAGPLSGGSTRVCTASHMPRPQVRAFGLAASFANTGSAPLVIERVALYKPRHMRLLDAVFLRQYGNDGLVGMLNEWPPDLRGTGLDWAGRVPADGAVIAPTKPWKDKGAYQEVLLLELWPDGKVATAAGVSIDYIEGGVQYRVVPPASKLAFFVGVGNHGSCSP
jgi:hypothetical protein